MEQYEKDIVIFERGKHMSEGKRLTRDYYENVRILDGILHVDENFDIIKKVLKVGEDELTLYYVDGFVKDGIVSKLMIYLLSLKGLGGSADGTVSGREADEHPMLIVEKFMRAHVPYVETEISEDLDVMIRAVLSGATLMLGSRFGEYAIVLDARTYPARDTGEPEGDKVMRGARDGFVETLIFNTALIRRRIRNPELTMQYVSVGGSSQTDVVICYMKDRADIGYVRQLEGRLEGIKTDALPMGHESLAECLIKRKWYDPFPKIR